MISFLDFINIFTKTQEALVLYFKKRNPTFNIISISLLKLRQRVLY